MAVRPLQREQDDSNLVQLKRLERRTIALVGNPNTGKSTLFNALTGLRQKVANYPGVTVDSRIGSFPLADDWIDVVDLPGLYSLAPHSPDERLAFDTLTGRVPGVVPEAVVALVDASNLERNLFLISQLLELDLPLVVALTMVDVAEAREMELSPDRLERRLGVPVVPVVAASGRGLEQLKLAIGRALDSTRRAKVHLLPDVHGSAKRLRDELDRDGLDLPTVELERALIDRGGALERRLAEHHGDSALERLESERSALSTPGSSLAEIEAEARYAWVAEVVDGVAGEARSGTDWVERVDRIVSHPVLGTMLFLALMAVVFQAVFYWATPLMELIDGSSAALGEAVGRALPEGMLNSLITDGLIAGVGAVIVFLPQIIILFAFILVLEDSGYMARAAFMMDRLMRVCGLSGQSFIPMLSSFACAVPGIMATRVISSPRDRLATVLAAPFMTCSARLPVYALLIAAFVPEQKLIGFVGVRGLVLLGLYLLGIAAGIATAFVLKRTLLRGPTPAFLMEMPPYRRPQLGSVLIRLWERVRIFLVRAGTVIFAVSVVVWALAYFPRSSNVLSEFAQQRQLAESQLDGAALEERLLELDHEEAAALLESSALGRMGKLVEPVFRPLGWDWRVSSAALASFPAREVVIAALGTIYAVGSEVDEEDAGLLETIRTASWPDGRPVFTLPMAVGLMVFFALCLQCGATIAAIRRETGSWKWPLFAWSYMTVVAYLGALVVYQSGRFWAG